MSLAEFIQTKVPSGTIILDENIPTVNRHTIPIDSWNIYGILYRIYEIPTAFKMYRYRILTYYFKQLFCFYYLSKREKQNRLILKVYTR